LIVTDEVYKQQIMTAPRGKLIAIGGAEKRLRKGQEDASMPDDCILRRILREAGGKSARIEVITTASAYPQQRGEEYRLSFERIGCSNTGVMHIRGRKEMDGDCFRRLAQCDCVFFTGGTQRRISTVFHQTSFLDVLRKRYREEGLLVAGTSAGAMAMGQIMIYKGTAMTTHLKGSVKTTHGLNLHDGLVFDSHFERSGRFARLAQIIALHPSHIGIGLGEDTAVVISGGNFMEVTGSGWVTIVDGGGIGHCNIGDAPNGTSPSIENIKVHIAANGNGYVIDERKFVGEGLKGIGN
jgi:cyanophycinase